MVASDPVSAHDPGELTAHALGLLDTDESGAVERHLAGCAACRREWAELRETAAVMATVPPETFLDGPPGADLVLQRALRQVRAEAGTTRRRRRIGMVAAAVVVVATLLGGGVVLGRVTAPGPAVVAAVPGARTVEGTEGRVVMSATIVPAAGWIRVAVTVRGITAGEECTILVIDRDGSEHVAGSWLASKAGEVNGTTVNGSAIVVPENVLAVAVRDQAGRDVISVPV